MEKEILRQKLIELYTRGKGLNTIAKEVGTSYGSIQRLFDSLDIPRREFTTKGLHPGLGKKLSDETKRKIGDKMRGRKLSPEHRAKVIQTLRPGRKLEESPCWKGGMTFQNGYVMIKNPNHPHAWENGYVKRAILVAEKKLGRPLEKGEITHHVNHVKDDDRPENIEVLSSHSEHTSLHNELRTKEILSRVEVALEKEE